MMSSKERFIPILRAYITTPKGKPSFRNIRVCHYGTKSKEIPRFHWQKPQVKGYLGLSSVASLCAGVIFYNSTAVCQDNPVTKEDAYINGQLSNNSTDTNKSNSKEQDEMESARLKAAIEESCLVLFDILTIYGAPAVSVCVSVNGEILWSKGLGLADVEQQVQCNASTVMRIASISKPLTMTAMARLIDEGKVDIEKSVQTYVPKYPTAMYKGKEVLMKVRHILSNTSGIRHYSLYHNSEKEERQHPEMAKIDDTGLTPKQKAEQKREDIKSYMCKLQIEKKPTNNTDTFNMNEFLIKENFSCVEDALQLFQHDELFSEPGKKFKYTTHGWTLVSAVIEAASGKKFETVMKEVFTDMGLNATYLDKSDSIIKHRARQYVRKVNGALENAPYVNNSYKYAGGGILSTADDLVKFGNVMLYSYQAGNNNREGYLKQSTVERMWSASPGTEGVSKLSRYGLGWFVIKARPAAGMCFNVPFYVYHTGAATGGSSMLLIKPDIHADKVYSPPEGIVVAILTNVDGIRLFDKACYIAEKFAAVRRQTKGVESPYDPLSNVD